MANQKLGGNALSESGARHFRSRMEGARSRFTAVSDEINDAIRAMRRSYGEIGLTEAIAGAEPTSLFSLWLEEAARNPYIVEANAMVLSTFDGGQLSTRTVLLKGFERVSGACTFFTNYHSKKARAIDENPEVTLLFPWYPMERQVIITARVEKVSRGESEEYFASRPWASQIGAWASEQSMEISDRSVLEKRWQEYSSKYPEGSAVPLPDQWGGYRALPHSFEFWQGRYSRLHDRLRFTRVSEHTWSRQRLAP
jgi:pyridoxamine 5'-phosphate oxidase